MWFTRPCSPVVRKRESSPGLLFVVLPIREVEAGRLLFETCFAVNIRITSYG